MHKKPNRRGWDLKRLFLVAVFAAATFAASFVLGGAITAVVGPGTSGLVTIIVTTILVVVCANVVESVGVFTLLVTLFAVLAIPTAMFGPPGPHKIAVGLVTGIAYDLVWELTGRRKYSLPFAAALSTAVSIVAIYLLLAFLNHPREEFVRQILQYLIPLYAALGFIGALFGQWMFTNTLIHMPIIKALQD